VRYDRIMKQKYGKTNGIIVLIHGGAGPQDPSADGIGRANDALAQIAREAMALILAGKPLTRVACYCLQKLEDDPQFNAGIGSALQSDGVPRLSASLMNGEKQSFSGVIGATAIPYPSLLVEALQTRRAKVITHPGTELLARELKIPIHSNITEKRALRWLSIMQKEGYFPKYTECDTVGVVIRDQKGNLVAASSTGGRGHEFPGRVGDTPTVAGNYASKHAAVAVTGHGEQITNDAVAARIETRIRDGVPLEKACRRTFKEGCRNKRRYGWITVSRRGHWGVAYTTQYMPYVVWGEQGLIDIFTLDEKDRA
jgi:L-asparaginase